MEPTDPAERRTGKRMMRLAGLMRAGLPLSPSEVDSAVVPLIREHRRFYPRADVEVLRRAYAVAERYHRGQIRKSGAPYVTHPLAVAIVLAQLGVDTATLAAALLHDTVEDTDLTLGQVHAEFGEEVTVLVDGVTKLDGAKWGEQAEAETFRKMILAAAADLRVLVIKLADRVHNLRTLGFHSKQAKRERIARQSMELLVPFAERLGIYVFKREMEDIAFATLRPEAEQAIATAMEASAADRAAALQPLVRQLDKALSKAGLKAEVVVRDRHRYSIYQDHRRDPVKATDVLRLGEVSRITVLVDGPPEDCYVALGIVHGVWRPLPGQMKDFIALPKYNMYRSLHTSVLTSAGTLELAIRTPAMHRVADYGIISQIQEAAESGEEALRAARRPDLEWLRNLLAWQAHAPAAEFLDSLRVDLHSGGIVSFTPSGEVVPLPRGATAIDFAYAIDTDLGHSAIGAVANGRLVQMTAALEDGQVVEILTGPGSGPSEDWLDAARTGHARVAIQQWLAERRSEAAGQAGRRLLSDALASHGLELLDLETGGGALTAARDLGYRDLESLYSAVAANTVTVADLTARLLADAPTGHGPGPREDDAEPTPDQGTDQNEEPGRDT
ncbi:bifunctional (p)ppGpp synthetase/guanosine-3',5'-bis(diphosphate) 3'-pyrophosphohydrolase [Actinomadura sp. BRA 177]|uniref:RelA/SpoT family protein n=1 Tax=Actinomadura sp. BRA 177 TaxID=2745202 RepID=UPI001595D33F|nr:HD domain-containing protein [Actinomadura sp. BRA 177]NVI92392.1 bifunctional (p)ppGpp synthetase/guanosine-3',5'-bis(diphosphate) 3'-pyrophosphohydrolase [Actinomadura sp. BRA 177]